ncbi:hypothetical protein MSG28_004734 [Choristoneura fumiferana]|uniref:Uncharacterized protein n=1 Tax=Choristoneura fumiferana TaxID=7141 RepID=A0ACC0K7F3_CHOFU|nr:hypothetical protein MSG28_004734 [Choristoneura fumiferana]
MQIMLSQTLMLVKKFHWIVIEDSENKTKLVENLLKESTLKYTHLNFRPPKPLASLGHNTDQESEILKYFVTVKDLEPLADNCTKVYESEVTCKVLNI